MPHSVVPRIVEVRRGKYRAAAAKLLKPPTPQNILEQPPPNFSAEISN